jgi:hypothetical protein
MNLIFFVPYCDKIQKGSTSVSKGERVIVIHAGGENGVVESALLIWRLSQLDEFRRL